MTRATVARNGYRLAVSALVLAIAAVAVFLLVVAAPDITRTEVAASPVPSASPAASARSAMALSPIGIEMPAGSDCTACHLTASGSVGTKSIPVMAHPLWGWRDCTACHASDRLVKTAPGHSGLHKDDCLVCHKAPETTGSPSPAPLRPEHMGTDKPCTACHGPDQHAPLPDAMKGRNNCWICHNGSEFTYLFESASPSPAEWPLVSPAASPAASPGSGARPDPSIAP